MGDRNPSKRSKYDEESSNGEGGKIRGEVVLIKRNLLGINDVVASVVDRVDEIFGRKVALHLITTTSSLDQHSAADGMYTAFIWLWILVYYLHLNR